MPARVTNKAPCITRVTFKLVHYALLINQLRLGLTFFKVLANFPTDWQLVPLDETIAILTEKAFRDNWFNSTYNLTILKEDLTDLLNVSTKGQLFQFNGALYEQTDWVEMGSPLGPLLANVFMSSWEEKLELVGKLPDYYRRYVDDTLTIIPNNTTATDFLNTLNEAHPSVSFTMENEKDNMLPFLGTQLLNRAPQIETKVYVKPTNTGLLVHYQSNVDNRYKWSLLATMIDRT